MPPTTRSKQGDRDVRHAATRDKLRRAFEKLHAEGLRYTEVSVEKLSAEADLTRTTFYAYFQDKVDLLMAWLEAVHEETGAVPAGWTTRDHAPTRAELRSDIAEALARYRAHTAVLAAARDTALFEPRVNAAYRTLVRSSADDLGDHIQRGQRGQWISADLPSSEIATWLSSMVHRTLSTTPPLGHDADVERLDDYVDIFWNTLYR